MPTNRWDFLRAFIVIGGLVVIIIFLVGHYSSERDVAGVLGIAAPVLAAAVGVSIGYGSGNRAGRAEGESRKAAAVKEGRKALAQYLADLADAPGAEGAEAQAAVLGQIRAAVGAVQSE